MIGKLFFHVLWLIEPEIMVLILWKNSYSFTKRIKLVYVIFLHLSEELREILKNKEISPFTETSQQPLFNY